MSKKVNISTKYQICTRCVMDTTANDIIFDETGVCNYCSEFIERSGELLNEDKAAREKKLEKLVAKVRKSGEGKAYDCIVGVSGGVDSSWTLVKVVELGLRPLAVHMDNGWNSELAQNNIANLINTLGVDLYTHVIDWNEYRDLMQAFFEADVIDIELLYDNAMIAVNYQMAAKNQLKYILAGTNQSTEGMEMPSDWNWYKKDKMNIKAIASKFGGIKLDSFPSIDTLGYNWYHKIKGIEWISFLDYVEYHKEFCILNLEKDYGYKRYPYKHYESIFTRFYQGFLLPEKFGVDKRKIHLSTLIMSGQMVREEALSQLQKIPYPSEKELEEDKSYFLKKMGWDKKELESYLIRDRVEHSKYGNEMTYASILSRTKKQFKKALGRS